MRMFYGFQLQIKNVLARSIYHNNRFLKQLPKVSLSSNVANYFTFSCFPFTPQCYIYNIFFLDDFKGSSKQSLQNLCTTVLRHSAPVI